MKLPSGLAPLSSLLRVKYIAVLCLGSINLYDQTSHREIQHIHAWMNFFRLDDKTALPFHRLGKVTLYLNRRSTTNPTDQQQIIWFRH